MAIKLQRMHKSQRASEFLSLPRKQQNLAKKIRRVTRKRKNKQGKARIEVATCVDAPVKKSSSFQQFLLFPFNRISTMVLKLFKRDS